MKKDFGNVNYPVINKFYIFRYNCTEFSERLNNGKGIFYVHFVGLIHFKALIFLHENYTTKTDAFFFLSDKNFHCASIESKFHSVREKMQLKCKRVKGDSSSQFLGDAVGKG